MYDGKSSRGVSPSERTNILSVSPPGAILHSMMTTARWRWSRSLHLPRRPNVPLLSGSVLVLLTLFLPVAYSQCGSIRWTGGDYLLGFGTWPGSLGALSYAPGRVPYFLTLVLAVMTLLLVLVAQVRPSLLHRSKLTAQLFVASGTLSLFMIGDFFGFQFGSRIGDFLKPGLTPSGQNLFMILLAASTIAVIVVCLRSRLLRSQRWIVWLFAIAGGTSVFMLVNGFLILWGASPIISSDWALFVAISPSVLYFVIPLGLWYQFGLSHRDDLRRWWPETRRRIVLLYVPVAVFDLLALGLELRPGSLWGLLPYFAGINLMFWGYLGLERGKSCRAAKARAEGSEHGIADQAGVRTV